MTTVMVGVDTDTQLIVPKLYEITGKQMGVLADALMDAYNREALSKMVRVKLERKLDEIVGGSTYSAAVFDLVDWAKRSGYLTELIQGALDMPQRIVTDNGSDTANFPKRKLRAFALEVGAQEVI